jgi:hypothetical protein
VIYKLSGSAVASTDAAAALDIREDDKLQGLLFVLLLLSPSDGAQVRVAVSFGSTSSFDTNDSTSEIAQCCAGYEMLTSGASQLGQNVFVPLPDVDVQAGERVYLHITITSTVTVRASAFLYTSGRTPRPATRRR